MIKSDSGKTASPSPPKSQKWRRMDGIVSFRSSKRVHGLPSGDHSQYSTTHRKRNADSFPNSRRKSASSVWRRVSDAKQGENVSFSSASFQRSALPDADREGGVSSVWTRISGLKVSQDAGFPPLSTTECSQEEPSFSLHKKFPQLFPAERGTEEEAKEGLGKREEGTSEIEVGLKKISLPVVDVSERFVVSKVPYSKKEVAVETDPHKLSQRQKQIDYGKNTLGYERYLDLVPRNQRQKGHPKTPDIKQVCSKRSWDGQVKKWRRKLHEFDPPADESEESPLPFSEKKGSETDAGNESASADGSNSSNPASEQGQCSGSADNDVDGVADIYGDWEEMEAEPIN